ncbi:MULTISPECIES: hypothetical protein [Exiguobacterium]|uniref:Uracil DNA glycosylase superfamily n=1 Tax=Exiguobacterium aurantiacum TaxID=33987 RepID=A0A377FU64_9BACL|nr:MULTISPECIES: hypothetical protein [Exiguobacterium]STO08351.1 Uncharacterised protein [Exiguobacterium aurantiacum]
MVQLSLKRKMKVLFVIDRLQDDDLGLPLHGINGLKMGRNLLGDSIPFGKLLHDQAVAEAAGHPHLKRIGVETMFLGDESFYAELLRGKRQALSAREDYYKTVQRYTKHLQAVHSKCTKLHTIVLFGRTTHLLYADAIERLEAENEHVAAAFKSMHVLRLPAIHRLVRDERIEQVKEIVERLAPSKS